LGVALLRTPRSAFRWSKGMRSMRSNECLAVAII